MQLLVLIALSGSTLEQKIIICKVQAAIKKRSFKSLRKSLKVAMILSGAYEGKERPSMYLTC